MSATTVRTRVAITFLAATAAAGILAGCTPVSGNNSPDASPAASATPPASAAPTEQPTRAPATYRPDGTAKQNLAYFNQVSRTLLDKKPNASGRTIVDKLVAAGFPKKRMQVTPDSTAVDLAADNKQFSVRIESNCIVGQAGNTGFHSFVAPVLATGDCLVGKTRAIDW